MKPPHTVVVKEKMRVFISILSLLVAVLWETSVYGLGLRFSPRSYSTLGRKCKPIASPLHLSEKNAIQDILNIKLIIKQIAPIFGYYAVMLAPIYGIGLVPFLGSMTDFSSLRNRGSPGTIANEYIVAPKGFTPRARPNDISDEYPVSADRLKAAIEKVIYRQPRITFVAEDTPTNREEFIQRSLIFRFPDVITVQMIPLEKDKTSTLAIHSYSVYGEGDFGVNGNRVRTWLAELDKELDL